MLRGAFRSQSHLPDRKPRRGGAGLSFFAVTWKKRCPSLVRYRRENLSHLTVFVKYPEQVRPYIYTTNQLKRIGKEIKRRSRTTCAFSSEESLISVLYLILRSENEKPRRRRLRGFQNLEWEEG
ncbi:transposase [Candidatus Solincola sp.]